MHPLLFAWFNRLQHQYDILNSNRGFRRKNLVIEMMEMTVRWVSDRLPNGYFYCTDNSFCSFRVFFFFRWSFVGILKMCQKVKIRNSTIVISILNISGKECPQYKKGLFNFPNLFYFQSIHRCINFISIRFHGKE